MSGKCAPGCTCGRHQRGSCAPGCTCGKHSPFGKATAVKCPEGCTCGRHSRLRISKEEENRRARARYRENIDKELSRGTRYREENREKVRETARESKRKSRAANPVQHREFDRKRRHGLRSDQFSALWEAQGGLCCYCSQPLPREGGPGKVVIDHDHTCCGPRGSCDFCRRGLACNNCNVIVGMAYDDPERLEIIAANLRTIAAATRERLASRPVQEELPINVAPLRRRKESA